MSASEQEEVETIQQQHESEQQAAQNISSFSTSSDESGTEEEDEDDELSVNEVEEEGNEVNHESEEPENQSGEEQWSEEERIFRLRLEIERLALEAKEQEVKMRTLDPELAERVISAVEEQLESDAAQDSENEEQVLREEASGQLFDLHEHESEESEIQYVDAQTAYRLRVDHLLQEVLEESPIQAPEAEELPMTPDELAFAVEELEEKRRQLEEEGFYLEAQQVILKIKELNMLEAQKFEVLFRKSQERALFELQTKQQVEKQVFEEIWSEKLQEYDRQAKEIVVAAVERQKWERNETEQHVRSQLYLVKPKFSKQILHMRSQLGRLVKQKLYEEADGLRRALKPLELKEIAQFEQMQETKVQQKMGFVKNKHTQEMEALKQRILKGKNELLHQKVVDQKRLEQGHTNAMQEFTLKTNKMLSKTKDFIGRQSAVLLSSPRKHTLDFSLLSFGNAAVEKYLQSSPSSRVSSRLSFNY